MVFASVLENNPQAFASGLSSVQTQAIQLLFDSTSLHIYFAHCEIIVVIKLSVLIYQKLSSVTLFTISMCCSRKKGFRHLFTFIVKALTYTYVPSRLAHFTHSASIV